MTTDRWTIDTTEGEEVLLWVEQDGTASASVDIEAIEHFPDLDAAHRALVAAVRTAEADDEALGHVHLLLVDDPPAPTAHERAARLIERWLDTDGVGDGLATALASAGLLVDDDA